MDTSNIDARTACLGGFVDTSISSGSAMTRASAATWQIRSSTASRPAVCRERRDTDGDWLPNAEEYALWKEKTYGVGEPNSRTGQMLSQKSLLWSHEDRSQRSHDDLRDEPAADRAAFGIPAPKILARDKKVTDTAESLPRSHRPEQKDRLKRPFYAVDETDAQAVVELCQENLNGLIREVNAANGY